MRGRRAALGLVAVLLSWMPAAAQVDDDQLRRARAELDQLQEEARELTEEYQKAWAADAELQVRIDQLQSTIAGLGVNLRRLREQVRGRAVEMYMDNAAATGLASLLISASPTDLDIRSEYLHDIRQRDQAMLNGLEVLTSQLESATEELQRDKEEQESVLARLEELSIDLNTRLEEGQVAYLLLQQRQEEQARREAERRAQLEAERRAELEAAEAAAAATSTSSTTEPTTTTTNTDTPTTTAEPTTTITEEGTTTTTEAPTTTTTEAPTTTAAPTTSTTNRVNVTDTTQAPPGGGVDEGQDDENGATCPVDGFNTFSDTWGAPRSGGRRHQGVDFLAARGTPVVAVEDGTIERMQSGRLGGITVWLRGSSGDAYYYAHLDAWAPGLSVGQEVSAGQQLGIVGTTGNAPAHIPHLHWEFHPGGYVPGGSSAVNPTPLARQLC